jgi:hypothetical protein
MRMSAWLRRALKNGPCFGPILIQEGSIVSSATRCTPDTFSQFIPTVERYWGCKLLSSVSRSRRGIDSPEGEPDPIFSLFLTRDENKNIDIEMN